MKNSRDAQIRGVDSDCGPIRPDDALRLRGFWSPFLRCVEVDDLHRPSFNRARSTKSYECAFVNYIFFRYTDNGRWGSKDWKCTARLLRYRVSDEADILIARG